MKRFSAVCGAVAFAAALALTAGSAQATAPRGVLAASQVDCNNAAKLTASAKVKFDAALTVAINRAKELGFTADEVARVKTILQSGKNITADQTNQLKALFQAHVDLLNVTADLAKVKAVLDTRLTLQAAVAAQNIACVGYVPGAKVDAVPVPSVATTPNSIIVTIPLGAPETGDGSMVGR